MKRPLKFKSCFQTRSLLWPTRHFTPKQLKTLSNIKKTASRLSFTRSKGLASYAQQLAARRVVSNLYNVSRKRLRTLFLHAKSLQGRFGSNLLALLEHKLDVVLYKINFCASLQSARQLINHQKVWVNGRKASTPHYQLQAGDRVSLLQDPSHLTQNRSQVFSRLKNGLLRLNQGNQSGRSQSSWPGLNTYQFERKTWSNSLKKRFINRKTLLPKCLHVEVSYKLATAIFLFSPQAILTPTKVDSIRLLKLH